MSIAKEVKLYGTERKGLYTTVGEGRMWPDIFSPWCPENRICVEAYVWDFCKGLGGPRKGEGDIYKNERRAGHSLRESHSD